MLAQRASDHVLAARALGVKQRAIVFRHMLPNSLGPVIVQATLVLAVAIIDAAALSFLGFGNPDDRQPEWGQMLGRSRGLHQRVPAPGRLPGGLHHRGRARLHADGRVAARGPRPEVTEVTGMTATTTDRRQGGAGSGTPLLSVEDLRVTFTRQGEEPFTAVDGVSFDVRAGPDRRPGRRVRLRQVGDLARDHGPAPRPRQPGRGVGDVRGRRPAGAVAARDARPARPRHRDDLPGPPVLAEPGRADRHPGHRGDGAPPRHEAQGRDAAGARPAGAGRHPRPRGAAEELPPPAQRRDAAARPDRDGAGVCPAAADRRRADHRARRDHPGPDPGAAQGAGRGHRHRAAS